MIKAEYKVYLRINLSESIKTWLVLNRINTEDKSLIIKSSPDDVQVENNLGPNNIK